MYSKFLKKFNVLMKSWKVKIIDLILNHTFLLHLSLYPNMNYK